MSDSPRKHGGPPPAARVILVILILAAGAAYWYNGARSAADAAALGGSGTIEVDEISLAAEVAGRVERMAVEEGTQANAGDLLVAIDTALLDAQERQARAALEVAQANLALVEKGARAEEIRQAEATLAQTQAQRDAAKKAWENAKALRDDPQELTAKIDAARPQVAAAGARLDLLNQGARAETVAQAEANVRAAEARLQQLLDGPTPEQRRAAQQLVEAAKVQLHAANVKKDGDCNPRNPEYLCQAAQAATVAAAHAVESAQAQYDALVAAPPTTQLDQARAALDGAHAQLRLAQNPYTRQDIQQAEAALEQARVALADLLAMRDKPLTLNAPIDAAFGQYQAAESAVQVAQARLDALTTGPIAEQLAVARAQVRQAEAALGVLNAQRDKASVRAPIAGTVVRTLVKTGETATPGMRLLTLANLENVRLTLYIPESKIGRVALHQAVQVAVDSFPGETFAGEVVYISSKAEFTPRNVQTPADRAGLVFAVKVKIPNPALKLKAGMPADAWLEP